MKNIKLKIIMTAIFAVLMITVCAIPCFAQFDMTGHYDPDGTTSTYYAYSSSECNRTINVSMYDLTDTFLKKVVLKTKHGEDNSFHIGIGGYDIVNFSSNQGLLETCKLVWTSGTGLCEEADLFINYYFRTGLSQKELNVRVEMRKWDPISISVKHYVESNPNKTYWHRSNYYIHSTDQQMTKNYYDYFYTSSKSITGYTLNTQYKSSVSGNFCYESLMGSCKNCPTSPRCHSYDLHQTDWSEDMGTWSTYKESKHGRIDWCDNREFWVEYFYDIKEYTISYNANGGSGAPSSQTKFHDYDLTLSETVPTRTGYTFKGWGTYASDTSVNYAPGATYTANSSRTLYAIWESNAPKTYTVSYNANGGTGAPASQIKTHNVTLTLRTEIPTRLGYTFKGWATSSSATTASYSAGGSYTANASVTLYAVWQKDVAVSYTVSYNANGGTGAPASQTKLYNVALTLRTTIPTRSGYTFLGWSASSTATSPTYSAGGTYTANASVVLYAVWSKDTPTTYTISFNANGGSGAPSSVTKTYGVTLYLPTTEPYRSNYAFLGWSTSSTATSPTYYSGGSFSRNANTTLYAVWEYDPATYRVYYNANGGSGAPASQVKTYGVTLTLSSTKPTRSGYNFLGWSTRSTATSATYDPGDSYTTNASVTLYAVWEKANYEFSISNLSISNTSPQKYDEITVGFRTDSWDRVNPYDDIPVQLYYDGQLMSTQYVDFVAYGVANLRFTLYVGDTPGNRTIEVRINWPDRLSETNTGNNSVSTTINVQDYDYEMSVDDVTMSGNYCAGETVISSFTVRNDSDHDITPDKGNKAQFTAYYYNGSQKVVIATDTWNNVVIPSGRANLVYFKWTVPSNLAGKTVYCECTINSDDAVNEANRDNNTATFSTTVTSFAASQTPNTRYESTAPGSYKGYSAPANSTDKATWTMWVYENNQFVLKSYGVQISSAAPVIAPSAECQTAVYANGKWTIRSGYGFTMSYNPTITTVSGYNNPGSSAYTSVQSVYATFPEFNYATTSGNCRTLQYVNGKWQFVQNSNAVDNERIHFIPVWFADGNYTVSVTASRVWTPAGMIEATRTANTFTIDGSIYDDYFVGN